jgi:hypothetical protein
MERIEEVWTKDAALADAAQRLRVIIEQVDGMGEKNLATALAGVLAARITDESDGDGATGMYVGALALTAKGVLFEIKRRVDAEK